MAVDLQGAQQLGLDVGPALNALDAYSKKADLTAATVVKSQDTVNASFAEAARQATAYSDNLARQQAELRNATAATQSAREALRQLTEQQRQLNQEQKKVREGTAEYQRLQRLLEQNKQKIAEAKQAIADNKTATDQERAAVEKLRDARRQVTNETKQEAAAARDAAAAAKQSSAATDGTAKSSTSLKGVLGMVRQAFFAAFAVEKVLEVGEEIRRVTAEFEKYEIVLTGAFNGDQARAQRALIQVRNFADANGLEITALTDTYVKLVNRGIIPTTEQLRQLSDIAATSGKNTDQFVEALLDAQTGEFERLKEFGIKVKNNGDTISFSFKGVKTEVKNTQDAISQYLFALGDAQGVQGQAAAQLKSLGGAAADSKNAFTELYQVIGERSKSIFGGLSNATAGAARALANYFKSTDQEALEQSAASIDRYARLVGARFSQIAADTKASGGNIAEALKQASDDQTKFIDAKLAKARRDLAAYYASAQQAAARGGGEIDAIDPAEVARYKTAIKLYEGQREAATRAYQASVEGANAEADAVGRIAALRLKIAAEEKARDAAPNTYLGNRERLRLVAQLLADNKLLNELLGKQDKAQQAINDKLAAALRALEQERATLTGLAGKAAEKVADDATERARLAFEEQLRQIEVVKQKLIERERAVRAAGGRGRNADGVIDGVQGQQLGVLRSAAEEQLTRELERIDRERQALLLSLQKDSDQKELDQLEAAFNEQVRLHEREAGVLLALEEKYQRDRDALLRSQATRRAERERQLGSNQASATAEVFGTGTGVSQFEAQRTARQQQLDADRKFAEARLEILKTSKDKDAEVERTALAAQILRIRNQQKQLDFEQKASRFSIYRLVLGENDDERTRAALDRVASQVVSSLSEIISAEEQAAAARVSNSTQIINELTGQLQAQIQLNEQGSASNIKGILEQIEAEKAARREALAEQRRAAKEKVLIDTITQASNIATAASEVFAAFSAIPFVGVPLGIAAAGLLIGAFTASKVQAYQAAGDIGKGFYVGGYTGDGNPHEESRAIGPRPYTYHKGEFVFDHEKTADLRHALFAPIHENRAGEIDWPTVAAILPDLSLPGQMAADKRAYVEHNLKVSAEPLRAEFDRMHSRLAAIEETNGRMADRPDRLPLGDGRIVEVGENGSTHVKNF